MFSGKELTEETTIAITKAAISAYCECVGMPEETYYMLVDWKRHEVLRNATAFARIFTKDIMQTAGPSLIDFWHRQGCPEILPEPKIGSQL